MFHRIRDNNAVGAGEDDPDDLGAVDITFDMDRIGSGYFEYANSGRDDLSEDNQAFRAGMVSQVSKKLSVSADFQKIDDRFMSFTNSDLNPTKNQQRLKFGGVYDLNEKQSINISYDNILGL